MPKRKQKRAGRVVRHKLTDGSTREYHYPAYKTTRRQRFGADSIEALLRRYLQSPEWSALQPHTRAVYHVYLKPFEAISHLPVKSIGRREILTMRDGIAVGRGNGAATGFMRAASTLFGWAVNHEWIGQTPVHRIKRLPGGELRAWTRKEADIAQDGLPEHLRRVVVLARYTGQRRGDLCAMRWSAWDGHTILLRQKKTGEALAIPCHPILEYELSSWYRSGATILTNALGQPWTLDRLSHALPPALKRLGLPPGLNVHGLRKLAATELADAGCSVHEIAAITGHRTLSMVAHYTRTADQRRLAEAAIVKLTKTTKGS